MVTRRPGATGRGGTATPAQRDRAARETAKGAAKQERRPDSTEPAADPTAQRHPFFRELGLVVLGGLLSAWLLYMIFPPRGFWPLGFVALVPWGIAICRTDRPWLAHWGSFLAGFVFFLIVLSWLYPVTDLGYVALCVYLAIYWVLAAWGVRTAKRVGISPIWSLPVVIVATEYLRAWVMTGFPWPFIAHAFYKQLALIQIGDLFGAYGVSFVAALVNGLIVEAVLTRWRSAFDVLRTRQLLAGALVTAAVLAGTFLYGQFQLKRGAATFVQGPKIGVIQEDYPLTNTPPYGAPPQVVIASYLAEAAKAAREHPDIIVFPETIWAAYQNIDFVEKEFVASDEVPASAWAFGKYCHEAVAAFARGDYKTANAIIGRFEDWIRGSRALEALPGGKLPRLPEESGPPVTVVLGSSSIEIRSDQSYPGTKRYNSALVYNPDGTQRRERYDKVHLVVFGEYVPFRNTKLLGFDLHWLYRALNRLSPFSDKGRVEYSLWPGSNFRLFDFTTPGGTPLKFGVPICYEDVMPYIARAFVWRDGRKSADFLVNISNDGWFQHGDELPQHLAIAVFRAVENRVSIVRSVNTGISGFIDPNGRLYGLVEKDGRIHGAGIDGFSVQNVMLDPRTSVYGLTGDWFARICLALATALWIGGIFTRWVLGIRRWALSWMRKHSSKPNAA